MRGASCRPDRIPGQPRRNEAARGGGGEAPARQRVCRTIAASEILVTTGATMGLYCALTALLEEGDEVLLPDPIYDAYQSPIFLAGGTIRSVRAPIENGSWVLTRDALEAAVTPATRVLLLNTPWNPVGTVFERAGAARHRRVRRAQQPLADQRRDLRGDHLRRQAAHLAGEPFQRDSRRVQSSSTRCRRRTR